MNIILSTYFTSKEDPQRGGNWKCNDFSIIKDWYQSIKKLNLNAIIFHDHCSDRFINKYSTERISFVYHKPIKDIMNARYRCYYDYLYRHFYKKIYCTDISDVVIMKDPFPLIEKDIFCLLYTSPSPRDRS